jgi:hypothetical protein
MVRALTGADYVFYRKAQRCWYFDGARPRESAELRTVAYFR